MRHVIKEKTSVAALVGGILLLLVSSVNAVTPGADAYREISLELGRGVVSYFPALKGYVVSVSEGEVFVDLAEQDQLRPGMELLVFRPGDDIVHPVTGEVLGKYDKEIGYLAITDVREKYSVGKLIDEAGEIRSGDQVRISARRIESLVLVRGDVPSVDAGKLERSLVEAGDDSGRFRILPEEQWAHLVGKGEAPLPEEAFSGAAALRGIGEVIGAELLLLVRLSMLETGQPDVEMQMMSLRTGKPLGAFSRLWPSEEDERPSSSGAGTAEAVRAERKTPLPGETGKEGKAPAASSGRYRSKELPIKVVSFVVKDLDRNGLPEVLLTDGRRLFLYEWEGGSLIWKWEEEDLSRWRILNLEAGDVDNDGVVEVLTTRVSSGILKTVIWSWGEGERNIRAEVDGTFLKILPQAGGGTLLLGQRFDRGEVFSGAVEEYILEDGECRPSGGGTLPGGINIFGLALADLDDDGDEEIISLGERGFLRVFNKDGSRIWESSKHFGGYPPPASGEELFGPFSGENSVSKGFFTYDDMGYEETGKEAARQSDKVFQGRILVSPGKGGGSLVFIPRNQGPIGPVFTELRSFGKGKVAVLRWEDGAFTELGHSRTEQGYISDLAMGDTDGDGRPEILISVNRHSGILFGKKGYLVSWSHPHE